MRNDRVGSLVVLAGILALCFAASAPTAQAQGNKPAQGDEGPGRVRNVLSSNPNAPFDAHDFSGVWMTVRTGGGGIGSRGNTPWPMTPWAQARYNTAKPGLGQRGQPLGNDPIMLCDPIGYPRVAEYQLSPAPSQRQADSKQQSQAAGTAAPQRAASAGGQATATTGSYPMEFVQTKDRLIEFFDFFYVHRTIYLDGRKLPADPDPTWYGYSVGHWDGNTLVVDTTGFNDESWLDSDGHPHSDQMQLQERFQRVDHDTIHASMTVTDPKAYTSSLVSGVTTWKLAPNRAMREDLCAPSDELRYLEEMREPAAEKK
jgi:hypothetical protein